MNKRQRKKARRKLGWVECGTVTGRMTWGRAMQSLPRDTVTYEFETEVQANAARPLFEGYMENKKAQFMWVMAVFPGEDGIGADLTWEKIE